MTKSIETNRSDNAENIRPVIDNAGNIGPGMLGIYIYRTFRSFHAPGKRLFSSSPQFSNFCQGVAVMRLAFYYSRPGSTITLWTLPRVGPQ